MRANGTSWDGTRLYDPVYCNNGDDISSLKKIYLVQTNQLMCPLYVSGGSDCNEFMSNWGYVFFGFHHEPPHTTRIPRCSVF